MFTNSLFAYKNGYYGNGQDKDSDEDYELDSEDGRRLSVISKQ